MSFADNHWLNRSAELAMLGEGFVSPNPLVGAVLVYRDKVIGEGWHQFFGGAHAEVNCLQSVLDSEKNLIPLSTLYITLEPCHHHGKTPPCTDLIISSGIQRVVLGSLDPNPMVGGRGRSFLTTNGIEVITYSHPNSRWVNRRFLTFYEKKRPFIILKWAESRNGFMGIYGERIQISSLASQAVVHRWRSQEDSILVGSKTALTDNPKLTVREVEGRNPLRILLDSQGIVPITAHLFTDGHPTLIVNQHTSGIHGNKAYLKTSRNKSIVSLFSYLVDKNILSIMVEGGREILQLFIDNGWYDEIRIIQSHSADILHNQAIPSPVHTLTPFDIIKSHEDSLIFFRPKETF